MDLVCGEDWIGSLEEEDGKYVGVRLWKNLLDMFECVVCGCLCL